MMHCNKIVIIFGKPLGKIFTFPHWTIEKNPHLLQ